MSALCDCIECGGDSLEPCANAPIIAMRHYGKAVTKAQFFNTVCIVAELAIVCSALYFLFFY